MLEHFVFAYREAIIRRCRQKVASRSAPAPTEAEIKHGVPRCLDDVMDALGSRRSAHASSSQTPSHRHDGLRHEFTAAQVVHDYGDVYRAILEFATEKRAPISANEFRRLTRCIDEVIAATVSDD